MNVIYLAMHMIKVNVLVNQNEKHIHNQVAIKEDFATIHTTVARNGSVAPCLDALHVFC